jgi:hypothetical protein
MAEFEWGIFTAAMNVLPSKAAPAVPLFTFAYLKE